MRVNFFAVESCLWANARKTSGLVQIGRIWHMVSLPMLLVLTEEQHAVVASQELFRWFSGPEDVLRVVLRVVLGSETWGFGGMQCGSR